MMKGHLPGDSGADAEMDQRADESLPADLSDRPLMNIRAAVRRGRVMLLLLLLHHHDARWRRTARDKDFNQEC